LPFCLVHPSHKPLRVPISTSTRFEYSTPPMRQPQKIFRNYIDCWNHTFDTVTDDACIWRKHISSTFAASSVDPSWIIPIAIFTIITRVMRTNWAQLVKTVIPFGSSTFILTMARAAGTIATPKMMHNHCICKLAMTGSSKNHSTTAIVTLVTPITPVPPVTL